MKATIDIPDAMYRQVKAHAALQGRAVREVTIDLYRRWLEELGAEGMTAEAEGAERETARGDAWLAQWDVIGVEIATRIDDGPLLSQTVIDERR